MIPIRDNLPVVYDNGEIAFENGFFFSTPGQGRRVFFKDLDPQLEDCPSGTPEFYQLDLAYRAKSGQYIRNVAGAWIKR